MEILDFFEKMYSKYERYWYPELDEKSRYSMVLDHSPNWQVLMDELHNRPPGLALDLGAGEGTDAIKLALLGYEVDALEGSVVGSEKIEKFSKKANVKINIIQQDVMDYIPKRQYDVVICNGLLHYIENKSLVLDKINESTKVGGFNLISLFSNYSSPSLRVTMSLLR